MKERQHCKNACLQERWAQHQMLQHAQARVRDALASGQTKPGTSIIGYGGELMVRQLFGVSLRVEGLLSVCSDSFTFFIAISFRESRRVCLECPPHKIGTPREKARKTRRVSLWCPTLQRGFQGREVCLECPPLENRRVALEPTCANYRSRWPA